MKRIRYTRSQGKLYTQRQQARLAEKDIHRWVFAHNMTPDVEILVRKWLTTRLNNFYCDLQVMYMPHAMAENDEVRMVDARDGEARDVVKALIKATGLNPRTGRCGWPFCLNDVEGGAM